MQFFTFVINSLLSTCSKKKKYQKKNMKYTLKNTVLFFSIIFITSCGGDTPQGVTEDFLVALAKQDFGAAKKLSTEKTAQMLDLIEGMTKMAEESGEDIDIKVPDFEMGNSVINGNKATCYYTVAGKEDKLDLLKVNGKWKVDMKKE